MKNDKPRTLDAARDLIAELEAKLAKTAKAPAPANVQPHSLLPNHASANANRTSVPTVARHSVAAPQVTPAPAGWTATPAAPTATNAPVAQLPTISEAESVVKSLNSKETAIRNAIASEHDFGTKCQLQKQLAVVQLQRWHAEKAAELLAPGSAKARRLLDIARG